MSRDVQTRIFLLSENVFGVAIYSILIQKTNGSAGTIVLSHIWGFNMERQPTCKDRVREHYKGRMSDLRKLWIAYSRGTEREVEGLGHIHDYGLSLDYVPAEGRERGFIRYQLSWGGPGDEFLFYLDENRRPVKIEYWFLDWFDGAKITPQGRNLELLRDLYEDWREAGVIDDKINQVMEG